MLIFEREQLAEQMLQLARQMNYLSSPTRMLVDSLKGKLILLFSVLAQWYLRHWLVITKIYQLLFRSFGESVSPTRRGDVDTSKSAIADTANFLSLRGITQKASSTRSV